MPATPAESIGSMGTVDLLLGLLAALSLKLGQESESETFNISVGQLTNALHDLQRRPEFEQDLDYLDFDQIGDSSYSEALEDFLFQGGTWGQHRVPNPAIATICLDKRAAERRLEKIEAEFGPEGQSKVERLRDAVLEIWLTGNGGGE